MNILDARSAGSELRAQKDTGWKPRDCIRINSITVYVVADTVRLVAVMSIRTLQRQGTKGSQAIPAKASGRRSEASELVLVSI